MGCVYMATCLSNGKKYVGKTKGSLKKRISQHLTYSKRKGSLFHKALNKYGKDDFQWEVLFEHEDNNVICEKEKWFISELGTMLPEGYNMTTGGEGDYTVSFTEEWKEKNQKRADQLALSVYCLETDTIYPSMIEASIQTNTKYRSISTRCNNATRKSIGLHFCLATEEDIADMKYKAENGLLRLTKSKEAVEKMRASLTGRKMSAAFCARRREIMLANNPWKGKKLSREAVEKMRMNRMGKCTGTANGSSRAIVNIDTEEYFSTMREAVEHYGLQSKASSNISSCCSGKLKTAYGFRWKYADTEVDLPRGEKR